MYTDPLSSLSLESVEAKPLNAASDHQEMLKKILRQIQSNVHAALELLETGETTHVSTLVTSVMRQGVSHAGSRTIEGIFDGQKMVGENGETYTIAPNYASKSKLVTGDRMKLIITSTGNFVYKQIGPVERERIVALLALDPATNQFIATHEGKEWKILTASVTYFHGEPGDDVVILVPKQGTATWAAVENIVKKPVLFS